MTMIDRTTNTGTNATGTNTSTRRKAWLAGIFGAVVVALTLGYVVGRARAAGIPTMAPVMTYAGTLTDGSGVLLTGTKNIQIQLWSQASGGTTPVCLTVSTPQNLAAGGFEVALPDTCITAVHAGGDLWTEVLVDGASLGRTKIGAVPYAVEAGNAVTAGTATALTGTPPLREVFGSDLSAADDPNTGGHASICIAQLPVVNCNVAANRKCNVLGYKGGWFVGESSDGTHRSIACVR